MAQKTEKEETEFKVPETLTLCVNNCGVTGNPATNNMCQKCFDASTAAAAATTTSTTSSSSSNTTSSQQSSPTNSNAKTEILKFSIEKSGRSRGVVVRDPKVETSKRNEACSDLAKKEVNRCTGCRRKVGLTGFRCRCGELFCWEHRYSDRHDCSYDYKAAGREAVARENPVVKAAKIVRV